MSSIAHNSYINSHLVDNKTGRVEQEEERILQSAEANLTLDSLSRSANDLPGSGQPLGNKRPPIPLPKPPRKKGKRTAKEDAYSAIAAAFGKISVTMGRTMGAQSDIFGAEQTLNTKMASAMMIAQKNQLTAEHQIDTQLSEQEKAEAKMKKQSKIAKDLGIACMVFTIAILPLAIMLGPAVMAAGAGLFAADATVETGAVVTSAVESGADLFGAGVDAVEMGDMADASNLAMNTFSEGSAGGTATATGANAANDAASIATDAVESPGKAALKWIGRKVLGMAAGAVMSSDSAVQGAWNKKLHSMNNKISKEQMKIGEQIGLVTQFRGSYNSNQQTIKRDSSLLTRMGQQPADVVSTFADMMDSVRQSSNAIAYAA